MEILPKSQEKENSSLQANSNTSSNSSSSSSNGVPLTTKTIPRSETNVYPTTFIQADTFSFKQVVQMLTGSSETTRQAAKIADVSSKPATPSIKTGPKKPAFKLYERRNSLKNLKIGPLMPGFQNNYNNAFSPRKTEILSPSMLDFPSLVLSPITPLIPDPFNRPSPSPGGVNALAEEKAIAEKGFYLHPSPTTTPRESKPQLLPLFPETSPRLSGSST